MSTKPRVVVTGMSINTALGDTLEQFLTGLLCGTSAISQWKTLDTSRIYSKIGGDLSKYDAMARMTALQEVLPQGTWTKLQKLFIKAPFSTRLSMLLAADAMRHAGMDDGALNGIAAERFATLVAGHNINENYAFDNRTQFDDEPEWIDSLLSLSRLDTDHAGCVSELFGLRGPMYTVGAACASGNAALRLAVDEIRFRDCKAAIVVGPVLDYNPMELHAMAIMGAISFASFNDAPTQASRPFDARREGFVPAHGGGALILESLESAQRRGATIHAEVLAVDASSDANHLPNPSEDGQVALMQRVLKQAGLKPEDVDYINAHATSTPAGDVAEAKSIARVFGEHCKQLKVNAPKSLLGHCCWSAPVVETVAAILQMQAGKLHASANIEKLDSAVELDVCADGVQDCDVRVFMKNSFGFGGLNSVSVLGRFEGEA